MRLRCTYPALIAAAATLVGAGVLPAVVSVAPAGAAVGTTVKATAAAVRPAQTPQRWAVGAPALPAQGGSANFDGLSCGGALTCVAVGTFDSDKTPPHPSRQRALVETLTASSGDTARFAAVPPGAPLSAVQSEPQLFAVSCRAPTSCVAVGTYYRSLGSGGPPGPPANYQGLIEHIAGDHLSAEQAPLPDGVPDGQFVSLNHIGCNRTECVASGTYGDDNFADINPLLLIGSPAGTDWHAADIDVPQQYATMPSSVGGIACPPKGTCLVTGTYTDDDYVQHAAMYFPSSTGVWTHVALPAPDGVAQTDLTAGRAACASNLNCVFLNSYPDPSTGKQQLVADTLTDGALSAVPIDLPPSVRTKQIKVNGLDCAPNGTCTAVADYGVYDTTFPGFYVRAEGSFLLRRVDGSWTAIDTPLPSNAASKPYDSLDGLSCTSRFRCTAVGSVATNRYVGHPLLRPLVETLVGGQWTPQTLGKPAGVSDPASDFLSAVQCGNTRCFAYGSVGIYPPGAKFPTDSAVVARAVNVPTG